jgi:hypothetical protein
MVFSVKSIVRHYKQGWFEVSSVESWDSSRKSRKLTVTWPPTANQQECEHRSSAAEWEDSVCVVGNCRGCKLTAMLYFLLVMICTYSVNAFTAFVVTHTCDNMYWQFSIFLHLASYWSFCQEADFILVKAEFHLFLEGYVYSVHFSVIIVFNRIFLFWKLVKFHWLRNTALCWDMFKHDRLPVCLACPIQP